MWRWCGIVCAIGALFAANVGHAAPSQRALAAQIEALSVHTLDGTHIDAVLDGCSYVLRRHSTEFAGSNGSSPVFMSRAMVDLGTARLAIPDALRPHLAPQAQGVAIWYVTRPNRALLYAGAASRAYAALYFIGSEQTPVVFEEPVARTRTQVFVAAGLTWPSHRDGGAVFVFYARPHVMIRYDGPDEIRRLESLETALRQYQMRFCSTAS